MKFRRLICCGCAAVMAVSLLSGCSILPWGSEDQAAEDVGAAGVEEAAAETMVMRVTGIDGNKVTGELGSLTEASMTGGQSGGMQGGPGGGGMPGGGPDGGMPEGGMPGGENGGRPEMSEGEMPEMPGGGMPEGGEGEMPDGEMPGGNGEGGMQYGMPGGQGGPGSQDGDAADSAAGADGESAGTQDSETYIASADGSEDGRPQGGPGGGMGPGGHGGRFGGGGGRGPRGAGAGSEEQEAEESLSRDEDSDTDTDSAAESPEGGPDGEDSPRGGGMPEGDQPGGEDGERPGMPGGGMPEGGEDGMSEMPEGEMSEMPGGGGEGGQPGGQGEMPGGNSGQPGGQPGGMMGGGYSFEGTGEEYTFVLTDDTAVVLEYLQGEGEGSTDDIKVGSVLEFVTDEECNALTVTVKNLNRGGGFGGSSEVTNGTAANTIDEDAEISDGTYTSDGDDENALRVDGASVTLSGVTIEKNGGESSNRENGDFYGQNAGLLALNGASVNISNATVSTSAVNGNGVFSYGESTVVTISDSVIRTTEDNSGGIQTTGGGTTIAVNLDIETQGNSAAAIRSDRGGGTVEVSGGTYVTNGTGSPAIYCTADISVEDAVLKANASEGVVIEGKNSVTLRDCTVTADMDGTYGRDDTENIHAIMIYQSMSGDAEAGKSYFTAEGGSITGLAGDMFYVTNTSCEITLSDVDFTPANDTFLRVEGNNSARGWGTQGANGGDAVLTATSQKITGNILVDEISTLELNMTAGSSLTGAVNPDGAEGEVYVSLDESSTWTLTADSYISGFEGDTAGIDSGNYHLYVDGEQVL